jgi:predicted Rossmann-fold nucleotide-binding protein
LKLFGKPFWENVINFNALVEAGTISPEDIFLFQYVETAEEAWAMISARFLENLASDRQREENGWKEP